jgi:hypothetical protein
LALRLPAPPIVIILAATAASMSSIMPLIASNMRPVNSSTEFGAELDFEDRGWRQAPRVRDPTGLEVCGGVAGPLA